MPQVRYLGKFQGVPGQLFTHVNSSPYLKHLAYDTGKWRSPVTTSAIVNQVMGYANDSTKPTSESFRLAVDYAYRRFDLRVPVKMLHLNDVFQQDLDIWSKSPGLPWRDIGYKTKDDIRKDPDAVRKIQFFWHRTKHGENIALPDYMGLVRTHVCDVGTTKVRAVWRYPAIVTFGEAVFALPLIRAYQNMAGTPIAYGYETATGGMRKIKNKFEKNKWYTAIDFKTFDQSVPAWLIHIAFDILRRNIYFCRYQEHGVADARRMYRMFDVIEDYFINTKIRISNGCRYQKASGVASGSYFTQLIDTIVNCIMISWISFEQFGSPPSNDLYLGDDSLVGGEERWDLDTCQQLAQSVEMRINFEISVVSQDLYNVTFLGYKTAMGVPHKDHDSWMTAMLFPERPDRGWDDVQSRTVGLLYANMGVDLKFNSICQSLIHLRKFDLCLTANMKRVLKHIGVTLEEIDPGNVPNAEYFYKFM